uniref:Uncharacterized protein n=1 Tax=Nelumbo nucifera TaxID=4432 RepID=A0A822YNC8_NELNU|nr:TPA_asm: hypothetical protein HUJ06_004682 [Nelumbo nucifera]
MQGKIYTTPPPPQLSDSNRRIIDTNGPSKRVYQVWKGSNVSFLPLLLSVNIYIVSEKLHLFL